MHMIIYHYFYDKIMVISIMENRYTSQNTAK